MQNKIKTFIFFGIVGSGKGTQRDLLVKHLKTKSPDQKTLVVYPGDEYRKLIQEDNLTSTLVKNTFFLGYLQPNFLTTSLVTNSIKSTLDENTHLFIDGYPRTISQSISLEEMMKFYSRDEVEIIYIEVGKEEATVRMQKRARKDDSKEGIERRFDEYITNVIPSFEYFTDKEGYKVHKINGEQSIEGVFNEMLEKLDL